MSIDNEDMHDPPTSSPAPTLTASFARKVTFASHQNDVPVLLDLRIENPSDTQLEGLRLTVSADPAIFGTREWTIDRIDAGATLRISDRRLPLAGGMLDKLTDRLKADVRVTLSKGDELVVETSDTVEALARNEWGGASYMPELLAAFVTPNDGFVQKILKDASRILVDGGRNGLCCTNPVRDSSRESSMVAGMHEQTDTTDLQDQELASLQ